MIRKFLQDSIRWFSRSVPVRGRHKLADTLGGWVAEPTTIRAINGINVEMDSSIQYHRMMLYDLYEENVLNYLRGRLKPGMVVFDPGANIGYFAAQVLGMVSPGGRVHSFEPSKTCHARIHRNNDVKAIPGWIFNELALTDHTGSHTFHDTPRVVTHGYAVLEGAGGPRDRISYEVAVTTVDAYCAANNIDHIDFLKLDIEDSELPALKGASGMLARKAIDTILVETEIRPDRKALNAEIISLLRTAGYLPFLAERNGDLRPADLDAFISHKEDVIWDRSRG